MRKWNFCAGPAAIPEEVLIEASINTSSGIAAGPAQKFHFLILPHLQDLSLHIQGFSHPLLE